MAGESVTSGAEAGEAPLATEKAFDAFFEAEYAPLVRHLVLRGADEHLAHDAAAETTAELWAQRFTVWSPRAWVRAVAWKIVGRTWAKRDREQEAARQAGNEHRAHRVLEPDDHTEAQTEAQRMIEWFGLLAPQRRSVMAYHYDGYTTEEIAELLGMELATVRSHQRHARAALRDMWDRHNGSEEA